MEKQKLEWRAGDVVEVRSRAEIQATLDQAGTLESLPYMPEMEQFCGKTFRVSRRADKVCIEGSSNMGRLERTVFLEDLRCDGSAHEDCQRGCLILWKEAWLKPGQPDQVGEPASPSATSGSKGGLVKIQDDTFFCQSTELKKATSRLPWWDARQYLRDVASGNLTFLQMSRTLLNFLWRKTGGMVLGKIKARLHPVSGSTPSGALELQPGELVQVRSLKEIEATLDARNCNRGLEFAPGMSQHCGRRYRVLRRLDRMILEKTGKMKGIANTVILQGVACDGLCSRGCPRQNYLYWREVWLKRAE